LKGVSGTIPDTCPERASFLFRLWHTRPKKPGAGHAGFAGNLLKLQAEKFIFEIRDWIPSPGFEQISILPLRQRGAGTAREQGGCTLKKENET
jgi:hypothetical protein